MAYNGRRYGGDTLSPEQSSGGRWDRDRFERVRAKSRGGESRESYRFVEDDRYDRGDRRGSERINIEIDDRYDGRGSRGRYEERDRYYEQDTYTSPPRRQPQFLEEDRIRIRERQLAPRESRYERQEDVPYRPARPTYIRRQSSLDTMDRRPMPRYGDRDLDVSIQVRPPPRRNDYDDLRYRDEGVDEDYRDVRIRRERERSTYRQSTDRYHQPEETIEEVRYTARESNTVKRGRTRMPKRLVEKKAVLELGLPYEEEEFFYTIRVALSKDEIDGVIRMSEIYRDRKSVVNEGPKLLEAPPPPVPTINEPPAEDSVEIIETHTTRIIENPTEEDIENLKNSKNAEVEAAAASAVSSSSSDSANGNENASVKESEKVSEHLSERRASNLSSPKSSYSSSHRRSRSSHSKSNTTYEADEIVIDRGGEADRSNSIALPLGILVSERAPRGRNSRDVKSDIRALENEKRALRLEREIRDDSSDDEKKDVVRIKKDRRGNLNLVRSAH